VPAPIPTNELIPFLQGRYIAVRIPSLHIFPAFVMTSLKERRIFIAPNSLAIDPIRHTREKLYGQLRDLELQQCRRGTGQ
jgi:hypothetical protein